MKRIAISQRVVVDPRHGERRDALDQRWQVFVAGMNTAIVPVPNHLADVCAWASALSIDGVLLSGGNSLAHLSGSGDGALDRDLTETTLLDWAKSEGRPVLAVCRGLQMLNHYLGGGLAARTGHAGVRHKVRTVEGERAVNSYHDWGIPAAELAGDLIANAWDSDGWIEGARHKTLPWQGIMWHPEREEQPDRLDIALFKDVFGVVEIER